MREHIVAGFSSILAYRMMMNRNGKATLPRWILHQSGMPGHAKFLLLALDSYQNKLGQCWPSQAALMDAVDLSERAVRDATRWLINHDFVVTESVMRADRRRGLKYTVNVTRSRIPRGCGDDACKFCAVERLEIPVEPEDEDLSDSQA